VPEPRTVSSHWEECGGVSQFGAARTDGSDLAAAISLSLMQRTRQYSRGAGAYGSGLSFGALHAGESEWETEPNRAQSRTVLYMNLCLSCGPGSSVGITTRYGLDVPGIIIPKLFPLKFVEHDSVLCNNTILENKV
jgi:hypothetical protein